MVGFAIDAAGRTVHRAQLVWRCRKGELETFLSADSTLLDRNDTRKGRPVRLRIDGKDWLPGMWTISPDRSALSPPDARGFGALLVGGHRLELRLPPNAAGGEAKRLVFAIRGSDEAWRSLNARCTAQGLTGVAPARETQAEPEPQLGDGPPEAISKAPPAYPDEAREKNVQGTVVMQVLIDERGRVVDTRVVQSVPLLDAAAVAAVRQWLWKPATLHGHPIAAWATVPVKFSIH